MTKLSLSPHQQYAKDLYQALLENSGSFTNLLKTTAYILQQEGIPMLWCEDRYTYIIEEKGGKREGEVSVACIEMDGLHFNGDLWSTPKNWDHEYIRNMIVGSSGEPFYISWQKKYSHNQSDPVAIGLDLENLAKAFHARFQSNMLNCGTSSVKNKLSSRRL